MLKVANSVIDASRITGVLPVANGGTNASTASITSFNNITGFTASGTTGTTSTNLVFATTPTLVGDVTLSTGNLVIGTSGKGIDFSITSHPAGMTSELLADYEEGTWTPVFFRQTTDAVLTYGAQNGTYTKIGRLVTVQCYIVVDAVTSQGTGFWYVGGFPFVARAGTTRASGARGQYSSSLFVALDMDTIFVGGGNDIANLGNGGAANNSAVIATGVFSFTMSYEV